MLILVLGGARSGKSHYAERLASERGLPVVYIATATEIDNEMKSRIKHHRNNRPKDWITIESPLRLTETIEEQSKCRKTVVVDCLTLWLNNQLFQNPTQHFPDLFTNLADTCKKSEADIILVANEVGLGIIPMGEISRRFVDEAGRLNQTIASVADKVFFIVAGMPLTLKDNCR
ncbi:MAG: bifunctional adenosylcobinamide kinase/adenosylcobinamide-phosphate guanylyltransferase [Sphingobacteriales bacterium]|nr:MAG: bifunctional adenosylcobinamide kinase/adenosylcobinamide-phosphate guanylyltransferase [Sphingobacteriales bacterium]